MSEKERERKCRMNMGLDLETVENRARGLCIYILGRANM